MGMRGQLPPPEGMACTGSPPCKGCTYGLVGCTRAHGVEGCSPCGVSPCGKLAAMLEGSKETQARCRAMCTPVEYAALEKALFHKEESLRK